MKLECGSCGAVYPANLPQLWGKTRETSGYGPRVVCVALVDDDSGGQAACRGFLGAVQDDPDRDAAMGVELTLL